MSRVSPRSFIDQWSVTHSHIAEFPYHETQKPYDVPQAMQEGFKLCERTYILLRSRIGSGIIDALTVSVAAGRSERRSGNTDSWRLLFVTRSHCRGTPNHSLRGHNHRFTCFTQIQPIVYCSTVQSVLLVPCTFITVPQILTLQERLI